MLKLGYSEELISQSVGYADTNDEEVLNGRKLYQELLKKFEEETDVESKKVVEAGGLDLLRGQILGQLIHDGADHFHMGQFFRADVC